LCGRYNLVTDAEALLAYFEIEQALFDLSAPRYNIAPSQQVPVIRQAAQGRVLSGARWGLVPHWSKESKPGYSTINARAESVADKPAYRDPFKHKRCLIPASGFYEWKQEDGQKTPYHIHLPDGEMFAFAGLWDHWDKEGAGFDSCTFIVTTANETMQPIHNRMPVILQKAQYNSWLNTNHFNRSQLESMLVPFAGPMNADPVSRYVNSPKHDDPGCLDSQ
jgi:putative SOS response-associated peptidase YedK